MLEAESQGYKLKPDEIEEDIEAMQTKGIILNYPAEYFSERTINELLGQGFTEEQIPYLREELANLGLAFKDEEEE